MSPDGLLTEVCAEWQAELSDAVRAVAWSPGGRVVAIDARGGALVDGPGRQSGPIGPDPIAAAWLGDQRVLVADAAIGVVAVGGGSDHWACAPTCLAGTDRAVVAGCDDRLLVWRPDVTGPAEVRSRCGRVRAVSPLTSTLWAVVGTEGLAVVDVVLDSADVRAPIDGGLAVATDPDVASVAVADVGGTVHLVALHPGAAEVELDGYPDRVRRLGWVTVDRPGLVAVAEDELTWWDAGDPVAEEPVCAVAHDVAITAMAVGAGSLVLTGDESGGVRVWSSRVRDRPIWAAELGAAVTAAAWRCDGRAVLVGCADGRLVRYRVEPGSIA